VPTMLYTNLVVVVAIIKRTSLDSRQRIHFHWYSLIDQ